MDIKYKMYLILFINLMHYGGELVNHYFLIFDFGLKLLFFLKRALTNLKYI